MDLAFENILYYGLLPIVISSENPKDVLETYISLYMREEVQAEGLVRNIGNFSRFLEAISFSHGAILNISNVARDCHVERKVVEAYIKILEDILLSFKIPVFNKKAKRALISHPKFYFFDAGVYRALRPKGPIDQPQETAGTALEGLIAQHLRAWNAYRDEKYEMFFWRSRGGIEVDFVLYGENDIFAIEVKNASRVRPEDLRALIAFRHDYPQSKSFLLYRGEERLLKNGILCLPCEEFLKELVPDKELSDFYRNQ